MSNLATLVTRVNRLLQDQPGYLASDDQNDAFREALIEYERSFPREVVEDLSGDDSTYQFSLGTSFNLHFSQVLSVEYPTGQRPQCYLEPVDYWIYRTDSTTGKLDLPFHTPATGETVRVIYTARHTIEDLDSATATTVPLWHEDGIVMLAAARMLRALADRFIHELESGTVEVDGINRLNKSQEAARRARDLERQYQDIVGTGRGGSLPGTVVIDWDRGYAGSGMDFLTHGRRFR